MNLCRLCGEEKSPLDFNIELNDTTSNSWSYRELIEHHSRVTLKTNKLLPQSICEECRAQVDGFAEFSQKLQAVQNTWEDQDGENLAETVAQFFPETVIKEDSEDECKVEALDDECRSLDDNLTFDDVFHKELNASSISMFDLRLDVLEPDAVGAGEVPESSLSNIDETRWSHLVKACDLCGVTFTNLIEFDSHQDLNHNTEQSRISCLHCSGSFKKVFKYMNHILAKHFHLEHLRYCCVICGAMFFNLVSLHRHIENCHRSEKVFQCLICGHFCENLSVLKKHKRIHDNDENFRRIYVKANHSTHKTTLAVDDCFKNEDGSVEDQNHFSKWSDFKISCSICTKDELTPIDYFLHHSNEHMDRIVPDKHSPAFKFTCSDCPEENFASLVVFCTHKIQKQNNQELSFRCIVCSKLFWNYVAYSTHLRLSHPTFQHFICTICGKMFDKFSIFNHHLTTVHGSHDADGISVKKRKKDVLKICKMKTCEKVKRSKVVTDESESDMSSEEFESHSDDASSDESQPRIKKEKKVKKLKLEPISRRRPNNRHRPEKQTLFGPEINSPEKLFANEIAGTSIFTCNLHLNVNIQTSQSDGEVPEDLADSQALSPLRWKDLLVCAVCKTKFTNITELTDHIANSHGARTRAFGCFNCDINYGALYESSLVNHLAERHYHEHLKLCCLVCSKLFIDFLSLVNHYKTHDGKFEILVCFICGFYAKTLDDLKEHKAYHIQMENSKPDNQKLCERVLEKFNRGLEANTINMEVAECERNPDGSVTMDCQRRFKVDWSFAQYQCPLCFVSLMNPFELFTHLRLKHPKEQEQARKVYSCNTCVDKKEFSGMHYFINHAAEFHYESLRFTCVVCSKVFWNYLALANHYKNHPSFTAVFCCHCGKLFHSITSGAIHYKKIMIALTEEEKKLKKEGKLETEESSHICHVCGKSCKNNYTLVKHITTHEEPDPSKMLQCHICSKLFNTKNKLAQHMVGHNNLRKWKCKTCGMSFNFKKLLQMHTRAVHENERSFACTFCEKRFFKKYDLTVHVRLHTGDFPYECPITDCDAKYPAWSNLFKHCQSRHKLDIRSEGYKKLRASEKASQNDDFISD